MVVDSSAIVAIIFGEPAASELTAKLNDADLSGVGTPTLVETGVVLNARLGNDGRGRLLDLVIEFDISPIAFTERHWREALSAHERFGRGRHPASLNFGDCLCYATAKVAGRPLLCTGDDFVKTDLRIA